jgi:hypothetical protein
MRRLEVTFLADTVADICLEETVLDAASTICLRGSCKSTTDRYERRDRPALANPCNISSYNLAHDLQFIGGLFI